MATQRFYDGQPGPDIRRELNNFEAILDGTVAAAQDASTAATSASVKAQQWADAAPGVAVETGKYSAKHWADMAQTTVTGGLIYRGSHSAASGTYPATPSLGDYYKISAAGTLGGVEYMVGDSIIYNGTGWDKIDSTDAVTSVAGRVGAVVLTKGDVGLSNVDNTSDANKPISSATQAALNAKVDKVAGKQLSTEDYTTAEKSKLSGVAAGAQVNTVTSVAGKTGAVVLAKADVGLTNVDNTSDANKPISTATQTALSAKEGAIAAGTAAQFWRGDKSWRDFFTDVRAATLTGLSTATNAVVAATDTVLAAIGKLQAQVSTKLDKTGGAVSGSISVAGNVLVTSPAVLGYGLGAGGTVVQATSKSTAVTLNKPTGQIAMHNAELADGALVTFQLNNNLITTVDALILTIDAYSIIGIPTEKYSVSGTVFGSGAYITVKNISAGSLSEALRINFTVIKGATS